MTEKKKDYLSPRMKVIKVQPVQIICESNPVGNSSMGEEDLDNSSFQEL